MTATLYRTSEIFHTTEATVEDLERVPGKAEILNGKIILMSPTGFEPGYAGDEIFASLREYGRRTKRGVAIGDNKGFVVNLPHRKSFSPDAAFVIGRPRGMKFLHGAPVFAVEVRSEGDYGPSAEREMAFKRDDYFATGTLVVWDVDLTNENGPLIRVYRAEAPTQPQVFRRGEEADAEPALPGWKFPVNDLELDD